MHYPPARRDPTFADDFFGTRVPDPLRWLENPELPETQAFAVAQSELARAHVDAAPFRVPLERAVTALSDFEKITCPKRPHNSAKRLPGNCADDPNAFYFFHNSGLQPQSILYRANAVEPLNLSPKHASIFFDPNSLSTDGTVALSNSSFSDSGRYFAYSLATSGSDWVTVHAMRVANREKLPDVVENAKFSSISWTNDDLGFFYTCYPNVSACDRGTETCANLNPTTCYHRLGTQQSDDIVVYSDSENPTHHGDMSQSDCGKYYMLTVWHSTAPETFLWIAPVPSSGPSQNLDWNHVVDDWNQGRYDYITNEGSVFYFHTNRNAPNYRIVKYDYENKDAGFVEVIAEQPDATITSVSVANNSSLVLTCMRNVHDEVIIHDMYSGALVQRLELPGKGSVRGTRPRRSHSEFFYNFSSFTSPGTIYRYDFSTKFTSKVCELAPAGWDPSHYNVTQEFYKSSDGTRVPMFIMRGVAARPENAEPQPTLLYAYGGFNIPIGPVFSPTFAAFVRHFDGIVAVANIRGGGEYGERWHDQGKCFNKMNCFEDFAAAACHLVSRGLTTHDRIAINGGSNGGLLVCACINREPELFGAAVAEVPVTDMFRFHKFTIGRAWVADYGSPDVEADWRYLQKYSPLHTIREQKYPATLLMTSDHDDRVVPLHTYKYIAELQHVNGAKNPNPLMALVEIKAGHGAGKPTKKRIETASQKLCFIAMAVKATFIP